MAKYTAITHEALMTLDKNKLHWLKNKGTWGAKSHDTKKIVAMTAALHALEGHFKLDSKLIAISDNGKKGNNTGKRKKNAKNTSNQIQQKKDKAWKNVPPKNGKKKETEWQVHLPLVQAPHSVGIPLSCRLPPRQAAQK
jgi:hypothetical protein